MTMQALPAHPHQYHHTNEVNPSYASSALHAMTGPSLPQRSAAKKARRKAGAPPPRSKSPPRSQFNNESACGVPGSGGQPASMGPAPGASASAEELGPFSPGDGAKQALGAMQQVASKLMSNPVFQQLATHPTFLTKAASKDAAMSRLLATNPHMAQMLEPGNIKNLMSSLQAGAATGSFAMPGGDAAAAGGGAAPSLAHQRKQLMQLRTYADNVKRQTLQNMMSNPQAS